MLEALRSALPQQLHHHLASARELAHRHATKPGPVLPTTVRGLDDLLTGGLPRGQMVELIGQRSSGRFSILLATLAAATLRGEAAALVDLGDAFDPRLAAAAEVALERLLWVRPEHLRQAVIGAEILLTGGFPLVVVDLGDPPVPGGRGVEASWLRLARTAESHDATLLVSTPYRASGTAAAGIVKTSQGKPGWSAAGTSLPLLTGLSSRLQLEKLRGSAGTGSRGLHFSTPEAAIFETLEAAGRGP